MTVEDEAKDEQARRDADPAPAEAADRDVDDDDDVVDAHVWRAQT